MIDDVRKFKRLDLDLDVSWTVEGQQMSGTAKLLDVTVAGACFRIMQPFDASTALTFTLEAAALPALPRRGRLRWHRRLPGRSPMYLCGVVFEDGDLSAWSEWLDRALTQIPAR